MTVLVIPAIAVALWGYSRLQIAYWYSEENRAAEEAEASALRAADGYPVDYPCD